MSSFSELADQHVGMLQSAMEDASTRCEGSHQGASFELYCWPQVMGNPASPQVNYCIVIVNYNREVFVYMDGKLTYILEAPNHRFWKCLRAQHLPMKEEDWRELDGRTHGDILSAAGHRKIPFDPQDYGIGRKNPDQKAMRNGIDRLRETRDKLRALTDEASAITNGCGSEGTVNVARNGWVKSLESGLNIQKDDCACVVTIDHTIEHLEKEFLGHEAGKSWKTIEESKQVFPSIDR